MYQIILAAYNGSPESKSALRACMEIVKTAKTNSCVHLLAVLNLAPYLLAGEFSPSTLIKKEETTLREELQQAKAWFAARHITVETHLQKGEPINVITDCAKQLGTDLIIVGHHQKKTFIERWWSGSVGAMLLETMPCSVLVAVDEELV